MKLWRISNHADLSGAGGLRAGGRWHSPGHAIVYLAEHPALALLEALVHLELGDLSAIPSHYQLLEIEAPARLPREVVSGSLLVGEWVQDIAMTRAIGDAWLRQCRAALLSVPSAIVPNSRNWLINPMHRDAVRFSITRIAKFPVDLRLVKTPGSTNRNRKE